MELKAALLSHQEAVLSEKEADLLMRPLTETEAGIKCFQSLSQAVEFIAERLERIEALELMAQLAQISHPVNSDFFIDSLFPELQKHHHELDFRIRYTKIHFPPGEVQFKLGGHMKELGCIHMDFVKIEQGWMLDAIWRCR